MNLFHPQIAAALVATISLAACVAPPAAPTIPVAPGPSKTLDMFSADQAACQQYAAAQISPAVAAANNQAVGGALLGGALGAGLGAGIGAAAGNAGKGAAIGAASGTALGIIGSADGALYPQEALQQQYDIMYGQCMAAHGNSVASPSTPTSRIPFATGKSGSSSALPSSSSSPRVLRFDRCGSGEEVRIGANLRWAAGDPGRDRTNHLRDRRDAPRRPVRTHGGSNALP